MTKKIEPIEISDDESEPDDVQIIEVCEEAPPAAAVVPAGNDDPELEAALAGLDADTEKQVHDVIQELNKHVEADMWKLAYEEANEEKKVRIIPLSLSLYHVEVRVKTRLEIL